jgi:glyoxylase-like metal-dependent hydrolase (beta-lactamase superfamily II)
MPVRAGLPYTLELMTDSRIAIVAGGTTAEMEHRFYQNWFEVWEAEPGVFVIQEPFHTENVKSYVVAGDERAVVIDTGMGVGDFGAIIRDLTSLPVSVINSHAHWDHVGSNWQFNEIAIHRSEAGALIAGPTNADIRRRFGSDVLKGPLPPGENLDTVEIRPSRATTILEGGEWIELGGRSLEVIHAPGHSPGGIVLVDRDARIMFSTDVVYAGALYAQFNDSNLDDYIETLKRLEPIAFSLRALYPSHGEAPIEPGVIQVMLTAMAEVRDGRQADESDEGTARHAFDGFSILVAERDTSRADRA